MSEQRHGLEWILSCHRNVRFKWGCTKDVCCHHFFLHWRKMSLKFARVGVLSELLYGDDLVLMSETIKIHRNKFLEWKEIS